MREITKGYSSPKVPEESRKLLMLKDWKRKLPNNQMPKLKNKWRWGAYI